MSMHAPGIRSTVLLASIVPAVFVAVVLTSIFLRGRFQDLDSELDRRGNALVLQLADAAEFAVSSQNTESLLTLAKAFSGEPDVDAVLILDSRGQALAHAGQTLTATDTQRGNRAGSFAEADGRRIVFSAPILSSEAPVQGPRAMPGLNRAATSSAAPLGSVAVAMSQQRVSEERSRLLVAGIAVTVGGVLAAALLGVLLSRRVIRPVLRIAEAVDRIGQGEQAVRVGIGAHGELGQLETGVNLMADRLDKAQTQLRGKIADATAQLEQKKDEAERANLAKSRFLAAASHDLRQPMHALNLLAASLSARPHCAEDRELIDTIESAAHAMSGLLDALLDMSRLDAGEMEVHVADFPAAELLDQIRDGFAAIARDKGITLRIAPSTRWLHSDPLLLQRIVLNLVSNALRYTREGAVFVACRRRGDMVRIEVRDSGIGVPQEAHDLIFEEFVQLANPERDRSRGLGLGLAIVQRLSRLLGHRVTLRSGPGCGSLFAVDVPAGTPQLGERRRSERPAAMLLTDRIVVVVEDDAASRAGMVALITSWGCRVIAAVDAAGAIELCAAAALLPDAVLSDYRLGGNSDGIEAIGQLRQRFGADLPAALVSGDTASEVLSAARAAGLAMLNKPTPPARLRAMLNRMMSRPEN
jgi:signal transduction histidine kinase